MIGVPCRRCGEEITAETEEQLVERVHAHIREVHGSPHAPAAKHLLAHAREYADGDGEGVQGLCGDRPAD